VAFFCAEYGLHVSLPIFSGGLGVLAGDILKETADRDLSMVAIGLLYRHGYFRQRLDLSGWQHEYWVESDPSALPMAQLYDADGAPLVVPITVFGRTVGFHVWCVAVGGVPLYLLDAERPENNVVDRWITARLYEGSRPLRLAQYTALGQGGVRLLRALGLDVDVLHLNEGHAVLAATELAAEAVAGGASFEEAIARTRERVVFTTHTPVPAGNETYSRGELEAALGDLPRRLGVDWERVMALGRVDPDDRGQPLGLTSLALRLSGRANGVSQRHGQVARRMWRSMFRDRAEDDVPIDAITNGVHMPTWMGAPMRELLDRHLPEGWSGHAADPAVWAAIDAIPDEELWAARCESRRALIAEMRLRSQQDRLRRGESLEYVEAAARCLSADVLTVGFARRLATYKRLHLLTLDPARALSLLVRPQPLQLLFAGKAHPQDDGGKATLKATFALKHAPDVAERVVFLEDYDLDVAALMVAGCDVWLNLPRAPLEASGTSGMKVVLNGGLHLSVLDGWWAEAYDGHNGWGIDGPPLGDERAEDARDAEAFYRLIENEVLPQFYERDASGVPRGWIRRIKASLATLGPRFNATRMIAEYRARAYKLPRPPG
jgi:starch phosphorylase